jgi:hypothetical protein
MIRGDGRQEEMHKATCAILEDIKENFQRCSQILSVIRSQDAYSVPLRNNFILTAFNIFLCTYNSKIHYFYITSSFRPSKETKIIFLLIDASKEIYLLFLNNNYYFIQLLFKEQFCEETKAYLHLKCRRKNIEERMEKRKENIGREKSNICSQFSMFSRRDISSKRSYIYINLNSYS